MAFRPGTRRRRRATSDPMPPSYHSDDHGDTRFSHVHSEDVPDASLPPGIRYHANMDATVERALDMNTCCDATGSRVCLTLTEFLNCYATALVWSCVIVHG